jgi:hypothetical protein
MAIFSFSSFYFFCLSIIGHCWIILSWRLTEFIFCCFWRYSIVLKAHNIKFMILFLGRLNSVHVFSHHHTPDLKNLFHLANLKLCTHKKLAPSWVPVAQPVILATWEVERGRITVWDQPKQITCKIPSPRKKIITREIGLEVWSRQLSACFPSAKLWVQSPVLQKHTHTHTHTHKLPLTLL